MMSISDWAGHWLKLPLVIYRDMMRGDVQNNDEVKSKDPTAPVRGDQIRVENKLYSTEKLANLHPGGPLFIKVYLPIYVVIFLHFDMSTIYQFFSGILW